MIIIDGNEFGSAIICGNVFLSINQEYEQNHYNSTFVGYSPW